MVDRIKGVRHREVSDDESRDKPLILWIAAKVIFMAAVLWFATRTQCPAP